MRSQSQGVFNQSCNLLGEENVLRLEPCVQGQVFALDKVKNLGEIVAIAKEVARHIVPAVEKRFMHHTAATYTPLYSKEN